MVIGRRDQSAALVCDDAFRKRSASPQTMQVLNIYCLISAPAMGTNIRYRVRCPHAARTTCAFCLLKMTR